MGVPGRWAVGVSTSLLLCMPFAAACACICICSGVFVFVVGDAVPVVTAAGGAADGAGVCAAVCVAAAAGADDDCRPHGRWIGGRFVHIDRAKGIQVSPLLVGTSLVSPREIHSGRCRCRTPHHTTAQSQPRGAQKGRNRVERKKETQKKRTSCAESLV